MKELNKEYLEQCPVEELFECIGFCEYVGIEPLLNEKDLNELEDKLKRILCDYIMQGDLSKLEMFEDNLTGKHIIRSEYEL